MVSEKKRKSVGGTESGAKEPQRAGKTRSILPRLSLESEDALVSDEEASLRPGAQLLDPMIDPQDSSASSDGESGDLPDDLEEQDEEVEDIGDGDSSYEQNGGQYGQPEAGPSSQNGITKTKSKFRPPTVEELDELHQAEASGGNTFSLQLEALLGSTLLPKTPHSGLKALLAAIHSHIMALPPLEALRPRKAVKRLGETIPFPGPDEFNPLKRSDIKWTLGWERPEEVLIGGSWGACGGYRKGKKEMGDINVVVTMPASLFSAKDRMDYRYFHKRLHYLAVIKKSFQDLSEDATSPLLGTQVRLEEEYGDVKRPVVVISAGKEQGLRHAVEIKIISATSIDLFPPSSLSPTKSLLRHSTIPLDSPTALYSTSILHDTVHKHYLLHLHRLSQSCTVERVVDSFLALWRIWASRRGISRDRGASDWFASILLGWVVDGALVGGVGGDRARTRRDAGVGRSLNPWAALKAAWEKLATADFGQRLVSLCTSQEPPIPLASILEAFPLVLVDPSGSLNILAAWSQGDMAILQHHAQETLALLEDADADHFSELFLRDHRLPPAAYDEVFKIDITSAKDDPTLLDRCDRPSKIDRLAIAIENLLPRGLSDRVKVVHCFTDQKDSDHLCIGLIYDPSTATRVLDVGPSSGAEAEGQTFRDLWGDKAELRRFKDGSIAESVVWGIARPEEAALIPSQIVTYLLERHLDITSDQVVPFAANRSWMEIVQTPASARNAVIVVGSEKLGFRPIVEGYEDLYKTIRAVDSELPLSILQIQPASELLRYSTPFVPHPIDAARYPTAPDCLKFIPQAEIVLQFESSPRWPDDLGAIQKVKLALMQKLAELLIGAQRDTKAGIVFDPGSSDMEDSAGLEVLLPSGVAFLIRIYHERERTLLLRVIEDEQPAFGTALPFPPRRLAVPAMARHIRRFVHLPKHHSTMSPLHHRFPSYSSAVRLLKRWFAAHMLSLQIELEAIELIMAYIYLQPGSPQPPASAPAGFVRAVTLLSEWDWKTEPLVVPLSAEAGKSGRVHMDNAIRSEIIQSFEDRRKKDLSFVHSAWVIGTEQDTSGLRWTRSITRVVANRVRSLSRASLGLIEASSVSGDFAVNSLFTTPLKDYDVLIHLHPGLLTTYAQAVDADPSEWESKSRFKNVQKTVYGDDVRLAFDPALSLAQDIQRLYGDALLVFFDRHGGQVIGLLWNPEKGQARALKPFLGYSARPTTSEAALVSLDKDAILGEIQRLGRGLISGIITK